MKYARITNLSNPKIKEALDIKSNRGKHKNTAFIIEGPHLIETALASGSKVSTIFFTDEFASKKDGQKILRRITGEIFEVPAHIINKLADTETPQGIIAIASYEIKKLDEITFKQTPMIVAVDGVQEPGNLGTIIRTSDAAGADAVVILKGTCDAFMQKTIRATAGSIFNIPIIYSDTGRFIEWLKSKDIMLVATALDSDKSIFEADLKKPSAFVFGNEAHGVSSEIKKHADTTLKIPTYGKAESLNVSASAAVCLYEAARQRLRVSK